MRPSLRGSTELTWDTRPPPGTAWRGAGPSRKAYAGADITPQADGPLSWTSSVQPHRSLDVTICALYVSNRRNGKSLQPIEMHTYGTAAVYGPGAAELRPAVRAILGGAAERSGEQLGD